MLVTNKLDIMTVQAQLLIKCVWNFLIFFTSLVEKNLSKGGLMGVFVRCCQFFKREARVPCIELCDGHRIPIRKIDLDHEKKNSRVRRYQIDSHVFCGDAPLLVLYEILFQRPRWNLRYRVVCGVRAIVLRGEWRFASSKGYG